MSIYTKEPTFIEMKEQNVGTMKHSLESLPPEQSEQPLWFLPPQDLCNFVLTSSKMRSLADNPKFWSSMRVNKEKIQAEGLANLLDIKRFAKVSKIELSGMLFTNEELLANLNAIALSSVEDLHLGDVDIAQVPTEKLAHVVSRLCKINLDYAKLTNEQCLAVLDACASSTTLVNVSLYNVDLQKVPAELLARAVNNLHEINLSGTFLTTEQSIAVSKACVSSTTLVNVSLASSDLKQVPAQLLAKAVKHLEKIDFEYTNLTNEQCIAVLEACVSSTTMLNLSLYNIDLHKVPPELLAQAAKHLKEIDLAYTNLTNEQCIALLNACISSTTLVNVNLQRIDLQDVPAELLAQAVIHLKEIDLSCTFLTTEQCIAVLEACVSSSKVPNVELHGIHQLQDVPAQLLARAKEQRLSTGTGCKFPLQINGTFFRAKKTPLK